MKVIVISLTFVFCLIVLSCKKKTKNVTDNPVPSVYVDLTVYPGDPFYTKIQSIGGWIYKDAVGINGIVIYRKTDQEFVAIERTSSHLPNDVKAKVQVMKDNFTLVDSVSGSQWRIFDGTVTKGPAEWSLRLYGTTFDGTTLRIRN
jgi:hypothetical protein